MLIQALTISVLLFALSPGHPLDYVPDPEDRTVQLAVGENGVSKPEIVPDSKVSPRYPRGPRRERLEATIIVLAIVKSDGAVKIEELADCIVNKRNHGPRKKLRKHCDAFWQSTVEAVSRWRYDPPPKLGNAAVDAYYPIKVDYKLQ